MAGVGNPERATLTWSPARFWPSQAEGLESVKSSSSFRTRTTVTEEPPALQGAPPQPATAVMKRR